MSRATQPKIISCKRLLKTGLNNVVLPTLFNDVNNIVQHCYTRLRARFRLNNLFNFVDNNFQQLVIFTRVARLTGLT